MSVNELCKAILQQTCMYTKPPFKYVNGHEFCPCISEAIRQAYIGGYVHGRDGIEPEVGRERIKARSESSGVVDTTGTDATDGQQNSGC